MRARPNHSTRASWLKASALQENRFYLSTKSETGGAASPFGTLHHFEVTGSVVINLFGPLFALL